MKQGRSLLALAQEVERMAETKRDFIAPSRTIQMGDDGHELFLRGGEDIRLGITELCHDQLANRIGIPTKYYDRMREEAPDLLALNVNRWLQNRDEKQMVRTLDGAARAFLSDRYRPLDYEDLMESILPTLQAQGCTVLSGEVTERRLYIKAVAPKVRAEIRVGEIVEAGVVIQDSEVGLGAVSVMSLVHILKCQNGMITNVGMRRAHLGKSGNGDDQVSEFFRDETRQQSDKAFWMKVQDTVAGVLDENKFRAIVGRLEEASTQKIEGDLEHVVERTAKRFSLTDGEGGSVLRHLIDGGDLSAWGLSNAVTRMSQDAPSYDRATELERVGGQIIELPKSEWTVLAMKN